MTDPTDTPDDGRGDASVAALASTSADPPSDAHVALALSLEQLRQATAAIEHLAADRSALAQLDDDERERLQRALASLHGPHDPVARRQRRKQALRARSQAQVAHDDAVLHATGIRELRRKPVFTTPNYFAPVAPGMLVDDVARDLDDAAQPSDAAAADAATADAAISTASGSEAPQSRELQHCYVCKRKYTHIHHFYDQLCPECADFNFAKRTELADLTGRVALLTGGRVKIGYQAGLKLLRCGARLIVTTRFPRDSAARYAEEPDFEQWRDRLEIFGLDLRHTPSVEAFCTQLLATHDRLDYIINNACQTVRRPPAFYQHMMEAETTALRDAPEAVRGLLGSYEGLRAAQRVPGDVRHDRRASDRHAGSGPMSMRTTFPAQQHHDAPTSPAARSSMAGLTHAAELSQVPLLAEELLGQEHLFPEGRLDQDLQQVDLRGRNSWRLQMDEVPSVELLEVQLVNAIAPFLINARLKPLMLRTPDGSAPTRDKHIVNVSAVEGQFYRNFKTTRHPHTNMAKAALNMMTRTAAADYEGDGIHMNSVDTGWVTDEDPVEIAARKVVEERFHPPLDILDGAARIVDPIIAGRNSGVHVWGQFLKDYAPTDW